MRRLADVSDDERRIEVDIGKVDHQGGSTEALRLLAAPEGSAGTFLYEGARVMTELFDELDLGAVDDETLAQLLHRLTGLLAGMSVVGYSAVSIAAEASGRQHLDVLHEIQRRLEADDVPE